MFLALVLISGTVCTGEVWNISEVRGAEDAAKFLGWIGIFVFIVMLAVWCLCGILCSLESILESYAGIKNRLLGKDKDKKRMTVNPINNMTPGYDCIPETLETVAEVSPLKNEEVDYSIKLTFGELLAGISIVMIFALFFYRAYKSYDQE